MRLFKVVPLFVPPTDDKHQCDAHTRPHQLRAGAAHSATLRLQFTTLCDSQTDPAGAGFCARFSDSPPDETDIMSSDRSQRPADIWQTAYGELQLQLPRETFDTWLRNARLIAHEDGTFIIGVHNIYAREWLEQRLKKVVVRTLSRLAQRVVEVRFVLAAEHGQRKEDDLHTAGPLLASLETQEDIPRFDDLPPGETGLNPQQTFEAYAVGKCNRLAHAAALAVIEAPGIQFNPLYIHGGVGVGKSHLLHAIGNRGQAEGLRVLYVTAETFTNDLVAAIRKKNTGPIRDKYRHVDMLLVDDVQFLAGKDSTQEEFYHTFNTLFNNQAQLVVAGNQVPGTIKKLDMRLRSRFEGGLVVEIEPPDYLTRVDILEIKARQRGFDSRLSLDLLEKIADEIEGSVRDLEGALNRVIATALLTDQPPTLDEAAAAIDHVQPAGVGHHGVQLALEDIVMATADYYEVSPEDLYGRGRSRDVSMARQVAMYIAREEADIALQDIGDALDGRNHSTVLYSCDRISDLMATDSLIRRQVQAILRILLPQGAVRRRPDRRTDDG